MYSTMCRKGSVLLLAVLALTVGYGSAFAQTAGKTELPPGEWRTFTVGDK